MVRPMIRMSQIAASVESRGINLMHSLFFLKANSSEEKDNKKRCESSRDASISILNVSRHVPFLAAGATSHPSRWAVPLLPSIGCPGHDTEWAPVALLLHSGPDPSPRCWEGLPGACRARKNPRGWLPKPIPTVCSLLTPSGTDTQTP